ncbi:MAG: hypothetical protein JWN73_643 [Betaproteobacteria bacterium]|nr:hypothetical protein [Betaproteobacteria bacterium]
MVDPHQLIEARKCGEIRYAVATETSADMSRVLAKFGLRADASLLVAHDAETAHAILGTLLWKDMAYGTECMPRAQADQLAREVLAGHADEQSRYFSNGDWTKSESWNPLTEATFDAGLIVSCAENRYFCIWFEDED